MFLLRHSEEIPNFLPGKRNFFYIHYEEIRHLGFITSQQGFIRDQGVGIRTQEHWNHKE